MRVWCRTAAFGSFWHLPWPICWFSCDINTDWNLTHVTHITTHHSDHHSHEHCYWCSPLQILWESSGQYQRHCVAVLLHLGLTTPLAMVSKPPTKLTINSNPDPKAFNHKRANKAREFGGLLSFTSDARTLLPLPPGGFECTWLCGIGHVQGDRRWVFWTICCNLCTQ